MYLLNLVTFKIFFVNTGALISENSTALFLSGRLNSKIHNLSFFQVRLIV
jgi:hypothetical protein